MAGLKFTEGSVTLRFTGSSTEEIGLSWAL